MPSHAHRIGKLSLDVDMDDMATALALRARAEELGWQRFPAVIAAVFERLAPADLHVRIDRLDIDLGELPPAALESGLTQAFQRALEASLASALAGADGAPGTISGAGLRAQPLSAALLAEFGTYLVTGTIAARAAAGAFDAAATLQRLIAQQPAALASLLHRHADDRHAIERLVMHAGEQGLRALLALLSPAHAQLILAYLDDFQRSHRHAVPAPMAQPALHRALWVLTVKYLLHEAGTQFNRRSYLAALIAGVARTEGLDYATLLTQMQAVAAQTRATQPLAGSLLAMLDALLLDIGGEQAPPQAGGADVFACAEAGELAPLLTLLRGSAALPVAMDALLRPISPPVFAGLIAQLQPAHAALIVAYVAELAALHAQTPLAGWSADSFERQLRMLALRYLLHDDGSQFNRQSWLRRLLSELAASAGVTYGFLLLSLASVLAGLRARRPLASSLPEALAQLAAELAPHDHAGPAAGTAAATARDAADDGVAGLLLRLRRVAGDAQAVDTLLQACTAAQVGALIAHLAPGQAARIEADIAQLIRVQHAWRQPGTPAIAQRIVAAALCALLAASGQGFDRARWLRQLLQQMSGASRPPYGALAAALAGQRRHDGSDTGLHAVVAALAALADAQLPPAVAPATAIDAQAAVAMAERFLRTGHPAHMGARLAALAAANPNGFAALARRLLVAASGDSDAVLERLLSWMLPGEIAAALLPDDAGQAAHWAEMLADQPGASMETGWRHVLDAALRGTMPRGQHSAPLPAGRLDRQAALRHWLDHGALPWWAGPDIRIAALLEQLASVPSALLHTLFYDPEPDVVLPRLRRAIDKLAPQAGQTLLARLAPWMAGTGGQPAARHAADGPAAQQELRLRTVAAAITGATLERTAAPAAPPAPATTSGGPRQPAGEQSLLDWLTGQPHAPAPDAHGWRRLAELLGQPAAPFDALLHQAMAQQANRLRWAAALPDDLLARLVYRLAPAVARFMLDLKTVLQTAWRQTAPAGARAAAGGRLAQELLAIVVAAPLPAPRAIAARLAASLAGAAPADAAPLLAQALSLARRGGYANLTAALQGGAVQPAAAAGAANAPALAQPDVLYIANAGLVLAHPFLPTLFKQLGVLGKNDAGFDAERDLERRARAVFVLQRLVDDDALTPEPGLVLNKLLCGIAPDIPIARDPAFDEADGKLSARLMGALLGNWPALQGNSPQAIRETFLLRDGRLWLRDDKWQLTVSRKTVDVLVDMLPWGVSIILYPWMPDNLAVTW